VKSGAGAETNWQLCYPGPKALGFKPLAMGRFCVVRWLRTDHRLMRSSCVLVYWQKRYEELVASAVDGMVNVADLRRPRGRLLVVQR
jgi:hypothetical protein